MITVINDHYKTKLINLPFRQMKYIAIFGAPRSGTSWLGQLFNSSPLVAYRYQPLFSFALKDFLNPGSTSTDIKEFYGQLLATEDEFILQTKNISGNKENLFSKDKISHLVWKEVRYHHIIKNLLENSDTKIIGIIRHPCAVSNSWITAPKEFNAGWNPLEEWRLATKKNLNKPEEFNGYQKWVELAYLYLKLSKDYPKRFFLVKYETLNQSPVETIQKLFDFAQISMGNQTRRFVAKSTSTISDDPYGVLRANKEHDTWRHQLNPNIKEAILNDDDFKKINSILSWE